MKYNEKIIALLNDKELSQEQLEHIYSELKEMKTEDEKIRKELIKFVKVHIPDEERYIAWLEKQGEKKFSCSEDDEYRAERLLGWLDTLANYIHHDAIVSLDLRRERMQQVEQLKTWLKSLKERIKPQWKPREAQLSALEEVCKTHSANFACRRVISNLLNELKKL